MRTAAVFVASALCAGLVGVQSVADVVTDPKSAKSSAVPEWKPADSREIASLDEPSYPEWSPDGRFVAYASLRSGPYNVWITDVATRQSRQAAKSEGGQNGLRWSPDGKYILYIADEAGKEIDDIFLIEVATGRIQNLTQTPDHAETGATWSPDGKQIVFTSHAKDEPNGEIAVIEVASRKTRFVTRGGERARSRLTPLWSTDGYVYFSDRAWSARDASVMRVRASEANGVVENLTPHEGESLNRLADISPDGRYALIGSNELNGWVNVALLDTRTRAKRWITREAAHHTPAIFSPDGKRVAFVRDEPSGSQIFLHDIGSESTRQLTHGFGVHELTTPFPSAWTALGTVRFSPDGKRLAYLRAGDSSGDIVAIDIESGAEDVLVRSTPEQLARAFVRPIAVTYPSADGKLQIPALVWIPPNLKRDGSHPGVVDIHGGPTQQTRPDGNLPIQVLVARGYIVISPNYRGSLNYDQAFQAANRGDPGGGELSDVLAAADWLLATGYVDPKRMAVSGASWGGYLALMALASQPDKWAAGVAAKPVADLHGMYEHGAPWERYYLGGLFGDPVRDADLLRARSPITHAARIRAPVLMFAGANDPRAPYPLIKEMERAMRANGGQVELHVDGEAGHFASGVDSYVDVNMLIVDFLDRHLRDGVRSGQGTR
jgi:dipeptidyl aminopeptidase/acylaminoacyl peptidase